MFMKPKVLIFIDWFKPGYKAGGPTTSNVNIVDHLSAYFDFYVMTADTDYHSDKPYPNIKTNRWVNQENCHVWYFSRDRMNFKNMYSAVKECDCHVWYINGIYSRFFSIYPLALAKLLRPAKTIVCARGMLSPHTFLIKPKFKKLFLGCMKFCGMYRGILFHGTNDSECEHIRSIMSKSAKCASIENLPRKMTIEFMPSTKQDDEIRLVSFARISPEKNTLYAIGALQTCKANVKYDIYGQINSMTYWQECENAISNLPRNVRVNYCGSINPTRLHTLYRDYDALYLPTNGENFGHAILECFMNSRPAIISNRTPWKSLQNKGIGADLSLDTPQYFANIIDNFSTLSESQFNSYCEKSFRFAQSVCSDKDLIDKYRQLFSTNHEDRP